jgi:hypothetical protein
MGTTGSWGTSLGLYPKILASARILVSFLIAIHHVHSVDFLLCDSGDSKPKLVPHDPAVPINACSIFTLPSPHPLNDTGDGAPFEDVVVTGRSGSTSCVGDMITYTCTIPAVSHTWATSLGFDTSISRGSPTFPTIGVSSQFSIVTTADPGGANPITTAFSVNATVELNGTVVTCSDGNQMVNDTQSDAVTIFGKSL